MAKYMEVATPETSYLTTRSGKRSMPPPPKPEEDKNKKRDKKRKDKKHKKDKKIKKVKKPVFRPKLATDTREYTTLSSTSTAASLSSANGAPGCSKKWAQWFNFRASLWAASRLLKRSPRVWAGIAAAGHDHRALAQEKACGVTS